MDELIEHLKTQEYAICELLEYVSKTNKDAESLACVTRARAALLGERTPIEGGL